MKVRPKSSCGKKLMRAVNSIYATIEEEFCGPSLHGNFITKLIT